MKTLLVMVVVMAGVIVAAALSLPGLVDAEILRSHVAETVEQQTGRALSIDGPVQVRILPTARIRLNDVSLANAPGQASEPMARIPVADVRVALWPLLRGDVRVRRITLHEPSVMLEQGPDGRRNWVLSGPEAAGAESAPTPAPDLPDADPGMGGLEVVDGTVTFTARGHRRTFGSIDLKADVSTLDGPLYAQGELSFRGHEVVLDLAADQLRGLLTGTGSSLMLAIDAATGSLKYDGAMTYADTLEASGALSVSVSSLTALASWLEVELPQSPVPFESLNLAAAVAVTPDTFALVGLDFALDQLSGGGDLSVSFAGDRPAWTSEISLGAVDLTPYRPFLASLTKSLTLGFDDQGVPAWAVDSSGLTRADAEVSLAWERLDMADLSIGGSQVELTVRDGALSLGLGETAMLGGALALRVGAAAPGARPFAASDGVLDDVVRQEEEGPEARGGEPTFHLEVYADSLLLDEILAAVDAPHSASGRLAGQIGLSAIGDSPAEMLQTLTGTADLRLSEGAVSIPSPQDAGRLELTNIDMRLRAPTLEHTVAVTGAATYRGRHAQIDVAVVDPARLLRRGMVEGTMSLAGPESGATFDGSVAWRNGPVLIGHVQSETTQLGDVVAWLTGPEAWDLPLQKVALDGAITVSPGALELSNTELMVGGLGTRGDIRLTTEHGRPFVEAQLTLDPGAALGLSVSSELPVILSRLTSRLDGSIRMEAATARVGGLEIGSPTLIAGWRAGRLRFEAASPDLLSGTVRARGSVDMAPSPPHVELKLNATEIDARLWPDGSIGPPGIAGLLSAGFDVDSQGSDLAELITGARGQGSVLITEGRLQGIDLPGMARNESAAFRDSSAARGADTDFAAFGASLRFAGDDILVESVRLLAPTIQLEGDGKVDGATQHLAIRLVPKMVADPTDESVVAVPEGVSREGTSDGNREVAAGAAVLVPILVTGALREPQFQPDLSGLTRRAPGDQGVLEHHIAALRDSGGLQIDLDGERGEAGAAIRGVLDRLAAVSLSEQQPVPRRPGAAEPDVPRGGGRAGSNDDGPPHGPASGPISSGTMPTPR